MLRINYYVSGHGFGHATRSAQVISALLFSSPTTVITIITTAPQHLFPSSPRVSFIYQEVDSGVNQPQPYTIDASASFAALRAFLDTTKSDEWSAKTKDFVQSTGCNLILADAPYPIAWAAHARGIKSVLISNFTFDAIFKQLLAYLPPSVDSAPERNALVEIEKLYASYDYILRLPGFIEFPFVRAFWSKEDEKTRLIDTPLVFRPAKKPRDEVLEDLGVPQELRGSKILLVQFGGQILDSSGDLKVPRLPEGWICLTTSPIQDPRFVTFPKDVYSPDLVAACDVVLGKFGYGTVSECVGMNKALVYVLRPMFAEEPGLLKYMQEHGICEEISVQEYESGNWAQAIERTTSAHRGWQPKEVLEGSSEVAKMIEGLMR